ncbi:cytosolic carboxypeptidase 2-like isoform X2 [Folsomia candida]|uniref:Cytosolic carboxypeptidase 2 n=1 Tax=Folsomia candida TaxID=158441 RepID=A0A226ETV0_FOLCA|nr:cytosolic carboxypeptidase 2-like isoform X2 [Folsomia candida]OXA61045.1 Cytosolic carboxypeptidase 2 [Folsomia candida]
MSSSVLELQSGGLMNTNAMGIFPANFGAGFGVDSGEKDRPVMILRQPRDLYSTTSLQHPPKWPVECQVVPEKVRHIETVPAKLEPFYVPTNSEPQPKPVGEEMGTIVYDYQPKLSVDYFCRSCVGGSEILEAFESSEPNALRFESRFESGNLSKAIKVTNVYYELHLRQDLYTDRHSQWFYFRIQNTKDNVMYRFSIVNFNKPDSLYKYGLKILMYSEKEAQLNKTGWVRAGQNISYFKNDIPTEDNVTLYTLTFNLKFKHSNDTIYLAHCYPYTYTRLQTYLRTLEDDAFRSNLLTVRLLCRSLAGNNVYVVTITSPDNYNDENQRKPAIVISARVHPGETQSSYMMKGIIDFLTSNCPQAKELRDRFIFKLIPMLNPDGVIVGNSRCCLLGQDLNRQYRTVLREAFPQIYQTKVLLRRLAETNGIFLYCDIHGHSRRNNVFIYGCENRKFPEKKLIEQVFPLMMHKNSADKFSFQNCKFRVQKNKEGTGRVFAWTLGVTNSFTLEISLGGSTMPSRPYTHFNTADYEAVGRHFCETLIDFSDPSVEKERLRDKILQKLNDEGSNADEPVNVTVTDYSSLSHSDSDESGDESLKKSSEHDGTIQPVNPLKRQASLRISKKRPKPTTISSLVSTTTATTTHVEQRAFLNLNKASVNAIRFGGTTISSNSSRTAVIEESHTEDFVTQKELAVFKRLTKFRRKQVRRDDVTNATVTTMMDRQSTNSFVFSAGPKCTSILFDDPFNPPGTFLRPQYRTRPGNEEVEFENNFNDDDNCSGSGTEDECDEKDGAMKNKQFAQKLPTSPGDDSKSMSDSCIIESFNQMRVSDRRMPSSYLSPFVPRLPQGKPYKGMLLPKKKSLEEESLYQKERSEPSGTTGHRRRASLGLATVEKSTNVGTAFTRNFQTIKPFRTSVTHQPKSKVGSTSSTKDVTKESDKTSQTTVLQRRTRFKLSKLKKSH